MTDSFGPYEVLERVAEGATSTVYRARHVELGRIAAIKDLHPDLMGAPGMRDRLRAEAELLAGLADPHVVEVYDYVEEGERAWIVEEWVTGASLARILDVQGHLTPEQSVGVVRGALLGLAHAHDRGLLHRDVSPTNVLADLEGTSKLVDFGLAAPLGEAGVTGTPAFVSPEAARGESLGKPSDVYSTAAVLYTLLAGNPPFAGSDVATTIRRHVEEPAPLLTQHGHDLQDLLRRSLAKDPAERPQDARAFLVELEEAARRRFGAAWLQRASIAALVAAAVQAVAGGGAAAPTVVVDAASLAGPRLAKAARSGGRRLATLGAAAAVVVAGATVTTFALSDDDTGGPVTTTPTSSTSPVADEEPEAPPPPTLEDQSPSGRFTFTRTLLTSTYDQPGPKRETRTWTLDLKKCQQDKVCSGTIQSSSGSTFKYTWNGKKFDVTPPKGGRTVLEAPCVDDQTGAEVPGSLGRVTDYVTWKPLRATRLDADGTPVRFEGGQRLRTTYEGLSEGCRDLPADHATYRVRLAFRR